MEERGPVRTRGSGGLDRTPEQAAEWVLKKLAEQQQTGENAEEVAEKLGTVLATYVRDRVRPEHHLRYVNRYLTVLFSHIMDTKELSGFLVPKPLPDPDAFAHTISEQADNERRGESYREQVVDALFEQAPGLRQRFSDTLLLELKEEIARDDTDFAWACHNAIAQVEERWRNQS